MTGPADPALQLARTQRERLGYEVAIAFDTIREGDMALRAREAAVPVEPSLALCTKGGVLRALRDRRRLTELMTRYDVVHAHASHDHALAGLAHRSEQGARLVRTIHHPRSAERRIFQRIAHHRTDALILLAEAHRRRLLVSYPRLEPARLAVIPGAVDPERFSPDKRGDAIREELGIPLGVPVIGMVARFQPGRRQEELIRALAEIRPAAVSVEPWLALIGKGETHSQLEAAVKSAGLESRTRFYGFRDTDLPEAIRSCDATVLLQEGNDASCRAVLQSLACGVPVIGARHAAIVEAIEGHGCGWLVNAGDVGELARTLQHCLSMSPRERAAMGERARARVLARYTETERARRVDDLYRRVQALPPVR